jgi:chromosome segregation ATPase
MPKTTLQKKMFQLYEEDANGNEFRIIKGVVKAVREKVKACRETTKAAKNAYVSLAKDCDKLKDRKFILKTDLALARLQNDIDKNNIQKLSSTNTTLSTRLESLETERGRHVEELQQLRNENVVWKEKYAAVSQELFEKSAILNTSRDDSMNSSRNEPMAAESSDMF